jgi:hypothetical protein
LAESFPAHFSVTCHPELGDGHYWQNFDMVVDWPLRFIGDESNPSNVIVEMSGTIKWRACSGFIEGLTFRRPKISSGEKAEQVLLLVEKNAKVNMVNVILDNEGSFGNVVTLIGPGNKGRWETVSIHNGMVGVLMQKGARIDLSRVGCRRCYYFIA